MHGPTAVQPVSRFPGSVQTQEAGVSEGARWMDVGSKQVLSSQVNPVVRETVMKRTLFQDVGRHRRIHIGTALAVVLFLQAPTWVLARQNAGTRSAQLPRTCQSVHQGGTFLFGVDQDVTSFDPSMTQDNGSLWADLNIYDQLVRLSPDAKRLVPDLAESWNILDKGRMYVFHLRHDARFYDGTPVTAQDVKFSFDHVRRPGAVVNWTLDAVKSDGS